MQNNHVGFVVSSLIVGVFGLFLLFLIRTHRLLIALSPIAQVHLALGSIIFMAVAILNVIPKSIKTRISNHIGILKEVMRNNDKHNKS